MLFLLIAWTFGSSSLLPVNKISEAILVWEIILPYLAGLTLLSERADPAFFAPQICLKARRRLRLRADFWLTHSQTLK
jgi:hypothetical protein